MRLSDLCGTRLLTYPSGFFARILSVTPLPASTEMAVPLAGMTAGIASASPIVPVAAVSRSDHQAGIELPVLHPDQLAAAPTFDVAIDFSLAPAFDALLDACRSRGAALVSGPATR